MVDLVFRRLQQDDAARAAEIVFAGDGSYAAWMPDDWKARPYEHDLEEWRRVLADPRPWKLGAATPQGRLIGVLSMHPDEEDATTGHLSALFVDPENQGRGVGAALLARCEDECRRRGMTKGHLWTPRGGPAEGFYEHREWRRNGRILWWEAAGMHIVGFVKPLV
jgi:GNAT superfamily N-acetyltransferase